MNKGNKTCTLENYFEVCPLYDAHDKLEEAYYFLLMMGFSYHKPDDFRFNLHAFIQALRGVTFMLQNHKSKIPNFDVWYPKKQAEMIANPYLKNICDSRTIIVHKRSLKTKSTVDVGLYRGRRLKIAITLKDVDPFTDSHAIFEILVPKFAKLGFLDKRHSAIDEQLGIRRQWFCDELGDEEIFKTCYKAYTCICDLMREAHGFFNLDLLPQGIPKDFYEIGQNLHSVGEWGHPGGIIHRSRKAT